MRLRKRRDFDRVYRAGTAKKGRYFHLYLRPNKDGPRLGIVIPRGWGSAVSRNRMRRLLREAFRTEKQVFSGVDLIVVPQRQCRGLDARQVKARLLQEFGSGFGGAR